MNRAAKRAKRAVEAAIVITSIKRVLGWSVQS
jgi:hypothetical protein